MDKNKQENVKAHEKWIRKIAREEAKKVLQEYKDALAKIPMWSDVPPTKLKKNIAKQKKLRNCNQF